MKKALVFLLFLAGCATAPQTPEQQAAAVGGATGCFAQGLMAAADTGKGEMLIVGLVLMPICAMIASNNPERVQPTVFYPGPWGYSGGPKGRGVLVSRK